MENNPYQTPSANLFGSSSATTHEAVPGEAITQLQRTKPWLRFFGVIMWIAVAYMVGSGIFVIAMGGIGAVFAGTSGGLPGFEGGILIGLGVFYILMGLVYIYPAIKLWKVGTAIKNLVTSRQSDDLVTMLNHQRVFWKFCGIMTIVVIALSILAVIAIIVVGAMGAMGGMKALEGMTPPGQ